MRDELAYAMSPRGGLTPPYQSPCSTQATLKVSKDESYTIELDPIKAAQGRDAFCKAVYQRVFDHLVRRVNRSLGEDMSEAAHEMHVRSGSRHSLPLNITHCDHSGSSR